MSKTLARRLLVGATLVTLTVVAGCSSDSDDAGTGQPATPKPSPTSSGPSAPADPSLVADLLSAQRMPGLNSETSWEEGATYSNEGPDFATVCQLHPWMSIGSTAVVRRDYAGPAESTAVSVVAEFATGKNARRADAVWTAWAHDCEEAAAAAGHAHPHINDVPYSVHTVGGSGRWWLLTYGPVEGDPQASYFQAFGLVESKDRLALIRMTSVGQDYSYEPGREPVAVALRRTARLLTS